MGMGWGAGDEGQVMRREGRFGRLQERWRWFGVMKVFHLQDVEVEDLGEGARSWQRQCKAVLIWDCWDVGAFSKGWLSAFKYDMHDSMHDSYVVDLIAQLG